MGPEVFELEEKLADYVGVKHCISCSSGTDALLIPLMALNIGPGDAVITTPFTYIATAEVISLLGATPVFCDIYDKTYNINADMLSNSLEEAYSKNLKPKAIIPVDLFGLPARYRLIEKFAKENDLFIIEDALKALEATLEVKKLVLLEMLLEPPFSLLSHWVVMVMEALYLQIMTNLLLNYYQFVFMGEEKTNMTMKELV